MLSIIPIFYVGGGFYATSKGLKVPSQVKANNQINSITHIIALNYLTDGSFRKITALVLNTPLYNSS